MESLFSKLQFFPDRKPYHSQISQSVDSCKPDTANAGGSSQRGGKHPSPFQLLTAVGVGLGLGLSLAPSLAAQRDAIGAAVGAFLPRPQHHAFPPGLPFASVSLALAEPSAAEPEKPSAATQKEPQTGLEFPTDTEDGNKQLAGMGVRNKNLLGLKSLKIYAFGVYADANSLREKLGGKYGAMDADKLKTSKWFFSDVITEDTELAVRLVIFYKGLKIGQVRNAFEESLGSRIKAISGAPNKELLSSFTKQFRDDFKLERGTTIEITRCPGHVLVTKIGGEEVGSVKSALMCRAFFDLYIGDEPFDKKAKESVGESFATALK